MEPNALEITVETTKCACQEIILMIPLHKTQNDCFECEASTYRHLKKLQKAGLILGVKELDFVVS